jgi:hypothetical protein
MMSFQLIKTATRLNPGTRLAQALRDSIRYRQVHQSITGELQVHTARDRQLQEMSSSQHTEFSPIPFSSTYPEQNFRLLELPPDLADDLEEQLHPRDPPPCGFR